MSAPSPPIAHDLHQALQRLNDSLQVLVLLLPQDQMAHGTRPLPLAEAAKQALEDAAVLRACFLGQDRAL